MKPACVPQYHFKKGSSISTKYSPRGCLAFSIGLAVATAFLVPPARPQAQAFTASLTGVVHDVSEAAIAGAKVTLASPDKGITRTFTTDTEGRYSFVLLPPGTYSLVIEAKGFTPYNKQGIQLAAGQASSESITLLLGQVQAEVTVSAGQLPLLATDNSNVSSDLNEQQVQQLPVNLRNMFGLVLLNSSVNNSTQLQLLNGGGQSGTADQDLVPELRRRVFWNHRLPARRSLEYRPPIGAA